MRGGDNALVCAAAGLALLAGVVAVIQRSERPELSRRAVADRRPEPAAVVETASQAYGPLPNAAYDRLAPAETAPASGRMDRAAVLALADRCAPSQPARTLASIARVESGYAPYRIGINGPVRRSLRPGSKAAAIEAAQRLIAEGANIDLGLAQINSRNLAGLGLNVEDAFDPCRNLAAAAVILERGYLLALKAGPRGQSFLETAYSLYNTGNMSRGLANGYAAKVQAAD
jgi:type IV secretion system protein VirB1